VLDVGCGPGFYCLELAEEVGPSGSVVGLDASQAMLTLAGRRCAELGNVELRTGDATALGVADADFDAALCVQVLEYVAGHAGRARGAPPRAQARRPGARLGHRLGDVVDAGRQAHPASPDGMGRASHPHVAAAGAGAVAAGGGVRGRAGRAHPLATVAFDPETFGGALLPFIATFVAGRAGVGADEAAAWLEAQRALDQRGEFYFAVTQLCFTAVKAS
jgi:SAM-dependent methyltransferase